MSNNELTKEERKFRVQAGIFLTTVGAMAAIFGFSRTVMTSKRKAYDLFEKSTIENMKIMDDGSALALRALAYGTLYAILGTGTFCFGIWKLSGAKNMEEFRMKMGTKLPRLTKDEPPKSRTEFDGLSDLMTYLSTWNK